MSLHPYLMIVNVQVAICRGQNYLFIKRAANVKHLPGILDIPGGKAEFNGSLDQLLEETARREIEEEVGLKLGSEIAYLTSAGFSVDDVKAVNVVFLAPDPGGQTYISQPEEVAAIEWHHYDELMSSDLLQPWTKGYLQLAEAKRLELSW